MNNSRRKQIKVIAAELDALRSQIEELSVEENEAFECMPENMQYSERGEAMEENVAELDELASEMEALYDRMIELTEK